MYVPPRYQGVGEHQTGETIVIKLPLEGYPRPTASWTKDGAPISVDGRFQVETVDRFAVLTIKTTSKDDSGAYRVVVENELDHDAATIQIKICDSLTTSGTFAFFKYNFWSNLNLHC